MTYVSVGVLSFSEELAEMLVGMECLTSGLRIVHGYPRILLQLDRRDDTDQCQLLAQAPEDVLCT